MEAEQNKKRSAVPLLLPPAEDYLGQWLQILQEHFPGDANELTALGAASYRLALGDLSLREIDIAFSEALKRHDKGFRPSAGELRAYLREAQFTERHPSAPMLEEPPMTDAEAQEFLKSLREKVPWIADKKPASGVVEITDEMRTRAEGKKREALEKFGKGA